MAINYLVYDGSKTTELGVTISGPGAFNASPRRGEMIQIPGRNGSLWMDEGCFENEDVSYPAFIGTNDEEAFRTKLRNVRSYFMSKGADYKRLEDTYNPDEYRMGVFKDAIEAEPVHHNRAGGFTLIFDCKPQRYLKTGDDPQTFLEPGTITNPSLFSSLPVIAVTGNGRINISGHLITVSGTTETIYIDSELQEAYIPGGIEENLTEENDTVITDELLIPITIHKRPLAAVSMNSHVAFADYKFPTIEPGEQPVTFDDGIESVIIYPRWWFR